MTLAAARPEDVGGFTASMSRSLGPRTEPTDPGSLAMVSDIAQMAGKSKQRAYAMTRQPGFPRPQDDLLAGRVWRRAEVQAWLDARQGRPGK